MITVLEQSSTVILFPASIEGKEKPQGPCHKRSLRFILLLGLLPALAQIHPALAVGGIFFQLLRSQFDGAVGAATGGEKGGEALQGHVQIYLYALVDAKGADPADGMPDGGLHLVGGEHFSFAAEEMLVFAVVHLGVAGGDDEHAAVVIELEGQGFGNASGLAACSLGS